MRFPVKTIVSAHLLARLPIPLLIWLLISAGPAGALGEGDDAADFEAPTLRSDRIVALSDHLGKVVYLDFWASWCDPCRIAIPEIEKLRT